MLSMDLSIQTWHLGKVGASMFQEPFEKVYRGLQTFTEGLLVVCVRCIQVTLFLQSVGRASCKRL